MKKNKIFYAMAIVWIVALIGCASPPQTVEYQKGDPQLSKIPDSFKAQPSNKLVAIVGIENKSIYRAEKLWDVASELLTTRLVEIGYFRVIDWQRMKSNFDAMMLSTSKLVSSPDQLIDVREKLLCDYFVGGSITFYDVSQTGQVSAMSKTKTITTTVRVDLWLQDSQTGEYLSAASGTGSATQQFSGGLLGGTIGTWDVNVANKSLTMAIDDALTKLLRTYQDRSQYRVQRPVTLPQIQIPMSTPQPERVERTIPSPILSASKFKRISNKWAIVLGVGEFMDKKVNPLEYTPKDAIAFYNYLIDPNYGKFIKDQVFLLINETATTFNLKLAIDIISKNALPEDLVVIFISTHGTPGGMDVEGIGYLVTYDTLVDSLYATAFDMTDLVTAINKRIKAQTIVTFTDACYSAGSFKSVKFLTLRGSKDLVIETETETIPKAMIESSLTVEGTGISKNVIKAMSSGKGKVVIASSQVDEKSWESDRLQHGFFTYYLLEALRKKGGKIPINEVFDYISTHVPKAVMEEKGKPQHPVIGMTDIKGDIYLGVEPVVIQQ